MTGYADEAYEAFLPRLDQCFDRSSRTVGQLPLLLFNEVVELDEVNLIEDLTSKPRRSSQRRLEQMIEFDEEQAAAILKQWVHEGVRA